MTNFVNWNRINNDLSMAILQADKLEELLDSLGCDFPHLTNSQIRGRCPVHGGDSSSFVLTIGPDDRLPIRWTCYSNQCQDEFKPSLIGLVRGILTGQRGHSVKPQEAVDYLNAFASDLPRVSQGHPTVVTRTPPAWDNYSREQVRGRLAIPSPYYLVRGFSAEVLDAFDVGESAKLGRAVVPLYHLDDPNRCVGFAARSYRPLCDRCHKHHDGHDCRYGQERWRMPPGFPTDRYLFNHARAKASDAPFILLVEGVGDVLRAAEAGLVAVAIMGSAVSDEQLRLLAALDREIWITFDNDKGGTEARKRLDKREAESGIKLRAVSFHAPEPYNDIGETPVASLRAAVESRLHGFVAMDEALADSGDERDWTGLEKSKRRLQRYEAWSAVSP